jgi:hypothetical protein
MIGIVRGYGVGTAVVLATLGAVHVYWAVRGVSGRSVALPERDGRPLFRPSRAGTLVVAGGLFGGALMLLAQLGVLPSPLVSLVPARWRQRGLWGLASVFALRAVGDFRYVGFFKRVTGTPFARWDSRLFSPLCALIALGSAVVATTGSRRS